MFGDWHAPSELMGCATVEAGAQANMALLKRVARALGGGGSGEEDPAI